MKSCIKVKIVVLLCLIGLVACSEMRKPENQLGYKPPNDKNLPNIVLIIADDISKDFGVYGGQAYTPNIDKLAANGFTFTNAYSTASSCSPSRNSIITGRYPHNHGAPELHMPLPAGQAMFPKELKEAGYYTLASGKWHMGDYPRTAFHQVHEPGYAADYTGANNWIQALIEKPEHQPFFMYFASFDAHRPWELFERLSSFLPDDVILPFGLPDTPVVRQDLAKYLDEVARFDFNVGEVVKKLKEEDELDNTVLIITSDNGRPFPRAKTTLYESGIGIPLIVHWPDGNVVNGATSDALVSLIDLAPTILNVAELNQSESFQGLDLMPIITQELDKIRDVLFAERNWHTQRSVERLVRYQEFAYIRDFTPQYYDFLMVNYQKGTYAEILRLHNQNQLDEQILLSFDVDREAHKLFNLDTDPHQTINIAEQPEAQEMLSFMKRMLKAWQTQTGDSIPLVDEMTKDRANRQTFDRLYNGLRPAGGVVPGQNADAVTIHEKGPVFRPENDEVVN
jgi:arylsulfatase